MKRESAANKVKILLTMLIACFAFIALSAFRASAASVTNYECTNVDSSGNVTIRFSVSDPEHSYSGGIVQLLDRNKNVVLTSEAYVDGVTLKSVAAPNQIYYYKVKPAAYVSGKIVDTGSYTAEKAFSTFNINNKASKKSKSLKFKCPKDPAIKSMRILLSTSSKGGYTVAAKAKRGKKTKAIKKCAGRKFALYTNYYQRAELILTDGTVCRNFPEYYYTFSRRFR